MLERLADVAPREGRLQHRQARLGRAEAVGEWSVVETTEVFDLGDGLRRVLAPSRHRQHPRLDQEESNVGAQRRVREPPEPGKDRGVPAFVRVVDPDGGDQLGRLRERAGFERMVDRLVGRPVIAMPLVGPAVELRREARLAVLELDQQQLREEVMEAVPLAPVVERDEEEVAARERVEPFGSAPLLVHRVAQRTAQPIKDRSAEHQRLLRGIVRLEHLFHEEIDHRPARGAEAAHEGVLVVDSAERE